jgi:hypothetical protein
MAEAILKLGDCAITLRAPNGVVSPAAEPYEDWVTCEVSAEVPGFGASLTWDVTVLELRDLATNIETIHAKFPKTSGLTFEGIEPNVALSFKVEPTGQINGSYALRNIDAPGAACLTGEFQADQSYLPDLARTLQRFVKEVTTAR